MEIADTKSAKVVLPQGLARELAEELGRLYLDGESEEAMEAILKPATRSLFDALICEGYSTLDACASVIALGDAIVDAFDRPTSCVN